MNNQHMNGIPTVRQYGARYKVGISNLAIDHSSGLVYIHPEKYIKGHVDKTNTIYVNYDRLPAGLRRHFEADGNRETGKGNFQKWFIEQIEDRITNETIFQPGDEILGLHKEGAIDHSFFRNTSVNCPMRLTKIKKGFLSNQSDKGFGIFQGEVMKIQIGTRIDMISQYYKLRIDGLKGTTVPVPFKFYTSLEGQEEVKVDYDLLCPFEALKGRLSHLQLFSYGVGGAGISAKQGKLFLPNPPEGMPESIDVTKGEGPVYDWVKANTQDYWVEYTLAKAEYRMLLQTRAGHIAALGEVVTEQHDQVVIGEDKNTVTIREKSQIIWGEMVAEVEISTPRENSGTSSLTMEMVASATLQNKDLGESLNHHSESYRAQVEGIIEMLLNQAPAGAPEFSIDLPSGRQELKKALGNVQAMNDGQVLSRLAQRFPQGVVLKGSSQKGGKEVSLYLQGSCIRSMSTIVGGVADGIAKDIAALFVYLADPAQSGVDQAAYSKLSMISAGVNTWLSKAIKSQSLMKRMGKSYPHAAVGSKVRTSANFGFLNHEEGELPRIAINSQCGTLRLLAKGPDGKVPEEYCEVVPMDAPGISEGTVELEDGKGKLVFNPFLMDGAKISIMRSPMPMQTVTTLVVNEEVDAVLDVAHVLVLPCVWGPANEGDTDGDGIVLLNVSVHGLSYAACLAMNKHIMGIVGYKVAYGLNPEQWPIAEFCSYAEKWGKKAVHWGFLSAEAEAKMVAKVPYVTVFPAIKDQRSKVLVSQHYSRCVGLAYNICVALTHQTLSAVSQGQDAVVLHMATVIAWRLLYEGLGLGGYSPKGRKFFALLRIATGSVASGKDLRTATYQLVNKEETLEEPQWETDNGLQPAWIEKTTPIAMQVNLLPDLIDLMGIGHLGKAASPVIVALVDAAALAQNWGAVEGGKNRVRYMSEGQVREAMSFGAVRRALGQGYDPAGMRELENANRDDEGGDEDQILPRSIIRGLMDAKFNLQPWVADYLHCPWLRVALERAIRVHTKAENYLFALAQCEDTDY